MLIFAYLKDLDGVNPLKISDIDGGNETKQVKLGVDVTAVITYKTNFVVNGQPVKVYFALGEEVERNTIF